jgi:hypothetical protein
MNTQTELHGKFQIIYRPTNRGIEIGNIELIDKYTDIYENSEGRFSLKVQIEDTIKDVIEFVYLEKLYISKEDAQELVNEFLN